MSKKESVKENIATLRAFGILFLTSIFGVLGYALANLEHLSVYKMLIGLVILVFLVSAFVFVLLQYKAQNTLLEELE